MFNWVRSFLTNFYITVVIDDKDCKIYGEFVRKSKIIKTIKTKFDIVNSRIDPTFNKLIKKESKNAYHTYISVLLHTSKQWVLPQGKQYRKFGIDPSTSQIVKMPSGWSIFVSNSEFVDTKRLLNNIKMDLVYSPFSLLYERIVQNKVDDKLTLYVYARDYSTTMMIFRNDKMKFGKYFNNDTKEDPIVDDKVLKSIDTTNLDDIIADEEDKLINLETLQDIDSVDVGFSDGSFQDIQTIEEDDEEIDIERSVANLGKLAKLIENIKIGVKEYYSNKLYSSDFIESIVIFDAIEFDDHLSETIQTEFLIEPIIYEADANQDLIRIVKRELNEKL